MQGLSFKWVVVVGMFLLVASCGACFLLFTLLWAGYGGQTIAIPNPFVREATATVAQVTLPDTNLDDPSSDQARSEVGSRPPLQTDASRATDFLPSISGYTATHSVSVRDALHFVVGESQSNSNQFSAQSLEQIATAIIVSRVDEFIRCYRQSGAIDAQVYINSDIAQLLQGQIPAIGAVTVINQTQLQENLLQCAVDSVSGEEPRAQASEPCGGIGQFQARGSQFIYLYAATSRDFCTRVDEHFAIYGG